MVTAPFPSNLAQDSFEQEALSLDIFSECCKSRKLDIRFRKDAVDLWQSIINLSNYVPVAYTAAMLDYQQAYLADQNAIDASVIIMNDRKPCAVWPLMLNNGSGVSPLSSSGAPLLSPLFLPTTSLNTVKSVISRCHAVVADYSRHMGKSTSVGQETFTAQEGLSEWYIQALRAGGALQVEHEMFVKLEMTLQDIRANIRKSYKPLITTATKLWQANICSFSAPDIWEEFRLLHLSVAGRATRSLASWGQQHHAIANGNAFFVYLRDQNKKMVGGGLFHISKDEGLYAVGAYNRELFDKPLGHLVQYEAINEMKRRGMKWYRIGKYAHSHDHPAPSDKEISISHFKQGFATHHFPSIRFESPTDERKT